MSERWLPVGGWEGLYEVSDHGRVRSLARTVEVPTRWGGTTTRHLPSRLMRGCMRKSTGKYRDGTLQYHVVGLSIDGIARTKLTHRLVLEAFTGESPPDHEAAHADGNTSNNHLTNLRWATAKENSADRIRHGRQTHKGVWRKVTPEIARVIRQDVAKGETQTSQCQKYGLSSGYVSSLISGRKGTTT